MGIINKPNYKNVDFIVRTRDSENKFPIASWVKYPPLWIHIANIRIPLDCVLEVLIIFGGLIFFGFLVFANQPTVLSGGVNKGRVWGWGCWR